MLFTPPCITVRWDMLGLPLSYMTEQRPRNVEIAAEGQTAIICGD